MTDYKVFVKDFVERTLHNLEFLEKKHESGQYEVYEFTQLVNSLLGLLVIPQQREYNRIDDSFIDEQILEKLQGAIVRNDYARESNSHNNFKIILKHMRNAIAHGRLDFAGKNNVISQITFKDKSRHKIPRFFVISMDIEILREFVNDFAQKLLQKNLNHEF